MKILQFTDPHLYGRVDAKLRGVETDATLHAVLDDAFAECPDFAAVLVTGDLVQDDPTGYARFRSIFRDLGKPVLCIPGNHDIPDAMRAELQGPPFQIGGSFSRLGWQIVMLDSYEENQVGGRLSAAELARLDAALSRSAEHALVCLHHHPIVMRSEWLDSIGLANADEFWRIIDKHSHVRSVVWGHVHQDYTGMRGQIRLFATPSTGAQFLPNSDKFAIDNRPPAYREFNLLQDGGIETRVHWVHPHAARRTATLR
jgi:Icc protein